MYQEPKEHISDPYCADEFDLRIHHRIGDTLEKSRLSKQVKIKLRVYLHSKSSGTTRRIMMMNSPRGCGFTRVPVCSYG